jgi:predicted PurR-regulated permease PerM
MEQTGSASDQHWTARRVISLTLVVVAVVLVFFLLVRFHVVAFSLFEAIVFATAVSPVVNALQKCRIPRPLGASLVFIAILAVIVLFSVTTVPLLFEQGATIASTVTAFYQNAYQTLANSPSTLVSRLVSGLPSSLADAPLVPGGVAPPAPSGNPLDILSQAAVYLGLVGNGLFATIAVLLLTFYWILERDRTVRTLLLLAPSERRDNISAVITTTEERVGAYLRGLAILSLVVGALALAAYLVIGLPHAFLLGLIAGLLEVVPLVGPVLGALPAGVVALSSDPTKLVWVVLAVVIIQFSENHLLVPRVMNKAVGVNPVVSLLAFAAFSSLFGLAGALLAIPMAVLIQILLGRFILAPESLTPEAPPGRDRISVLRYETMELVGDVRKQVRIKEGDLVEAQDEVEDAIEAIANDLDSILALEESGEDGKA